MPDVSPLSLDSLPIEILWTIFNELDQSDILALALTNSYLNEIATRKLYRNLYLKDFHHLKLKDHDKVLKKWTFLVAPHKPLFFNDPEHLGYSNKNHRGGKTTNPDTLRQQQYARSLQTLLATLKAKPHYIPYIKKVCVDTKSDTYDIILNSDTSHPELCWFNMLVKLFITVMGSSRYSKNVYFLNYELYESLRLIISGLYEMRDYPTGMEEAIDAYADNCDGLQNLKSTFKAFGKSTRIRPIELVNARNYFINPDFLSLVSNGDNFLSNFSRYTDTQSLWLRQTKPKFINTKILEVELFLYQSSNLAIVSKAFEKSRSLIKYPGNIEKLILVLYTNNELKFLSIVNILKQQNNKSFYFDRLRELEFQWVLFSERTFNQIIGFVLESLPNLQCLNMIFWYDETFGNNGQPTMKEIFLEALKTVEKTKYSRLEDLKFDFAENSGKVLKSELPIKYDSTTNSYVPTCDCSQCFKYFTPLIKSKKSKKQKDGIIRTAAIRSELIKKFASEMFVKKSPLHVNQETHFNRIVNGFDNECFWEAWQLKSPELEKEQEQMLPVNEFLLLQYHQHFDLFRELLRIFKNLRWLDIDGIPLILKQSKYSADFQINLAFDYGSIVNDFKQTVEH